MGQPKYGGIGGRGGNVILVADEGNSIISLLNSYCLIFFYFTEISLTHVLKKNSTRLIKALSGENSHAHKLVGDPGPDCIVHVPVGVTVYSQGGTKIGILQSTKS
jgi:GTPase involved in cell partitioning and DNA repair